MRGKTIEQALAWAYVDQKVHLARPEGTPVELGRKMKPRLAVMEFGAETVDDSMHFDFEAHADAYLIHEAVMALHPFQYVRSAGEVEMLVARRMFGEQVTASGSVADMSYHARDDKGGMVVEHVGRLSASDIRKRVLTMPGPIMRPRDLVIHHAIIGKRPDRADDPMYIAERGRTFFSDAGRRWGWVMVQWVGDDPLKVIEMRRVYATWWAALDLLRERLIGQLTAFEVEPSMPANPYPIDCS